MSDTATATPTVEVGDFFYSSWGYDQTNVSFYKVVGKTASGKSVKVQKWSSAIAPGTESGGPQEYVVPGEGPAVGAYVKAEGGWREYDPQATPPVETKRLKTGGYKDFAITISSHEHAWKWDGQGQYQTGYGWGH